MMARTGKPSVLLAAIAAFASACAQLSVAVPARNREVESARAHRQRMLMLADKVETSLATGDFASAQRAALEYRAAPDAAPNLLAEWRRRIWTLSENWGDGDGSHQAKREIEEAIAKLRRQYQHERKMSRQAFAQWLAKQGATRGEPLFSKIDVRDDNVELWVTKEKMSALDFNMKRLGTINDALSRGAAAMGARTSGPQTPGFRFIWRA